MNKEKENKKNQKKNQPMILIMKMLAFVNY